MPARLGAYILILLAHIAICFFAHRVSDATVRLGLYRTVADLQQGDSHAFQAAASWIGLAETSESFVLFVTVFAALTFYVTLAFGGDDAAWVAWGASRAATAVCTAVFASVEDVATHFQLVLSSFGLAFTLRAASRLETTPTSRRTALAHVLGVVAFLVLIMFVSSASRTSALVVLACCFTQGVYDAITAGVIWAHASPGDLLFRLADNHSVLVVHTAQVCTSVWNGFTLITSLAAEHKRHEFAALGASTTGIVEVGVSLIFVVALLCCLLPAELTPRKREAQPLLPVLSASAAPPEPRRRKTRTPIAAPVAGSGSKDPIRFFL